MNEDRKMTICDLCEHSSHDGKWCNEFDYLISHDQLVMKKCYAFEEKSFTNLFEAYEAEQKKRKAEERK